MYIEQIAQERDQIYWACSAQSSEILYVDAYKVHIHSTCYHWHFWQHANDSMRLLAKKFAREQAMVI